MNKPRYFHCIIGPADQTRLPDGADFPMRRAAKDAFLKLVGHDAADCWSGWGVGEEEKEHILNLSSESAAKDAVINDLRRQIQDAQFEIARQKARVEHLEGCIATGHLPIWNQNKEPIV